MANHPFATCTYQEFDPSYGVPVRSTAGHPQFKLRYRIEYQLGQASPKRAYLRAPIPSFIRQYRAQLDSFGVDFFDQAAQQMCRGTDDGTPAVLLCFDKLWMMQPPNVCHRRVFAEWYEEHTGIVVPELGRTDTHSANRIPIPPGLW